MTSDETLRDVLDDLAAPSRTLAPDWSDVVGRSRSIAPPGEEAVERRPWRRRRGVLLAVGASVAAAAVGVAVAASGDILQGPAAPPRYDTALRELMPPLGIGRARELASHDGRTLFGARTRAAGYCFSATSPVDRGAQGGHCVSAAEARSLDRRGFVAFAMSGSSVGGFAPGADSVRVTGAGLDVVVPVSDAGWWVGEARLGEPPLPPGAVAATVVATGYTAAGEVVGRDRLLEITRAGEPPAAVYRIVFV